MLHSMLMLHSKANSRQRCLRLCSRLHSRLHWRGQLQGGGLKEVAFDWQRSELCSRRHLMQEDMFANQQRHCVVACFDLIYI